MGSKASHTDTYDDTPMLISCAIWPLSLALECATFVLTMVSIRQFNIHRRWRDHSNIVRIICRDGERTLALGPRLSLITFGVGVAYFLVREYGLHAPAAI